MQCLMSAFVLSQIDDCNVVLAELPAITIEPVQCVMHAAACLGPLDNVTQTLRELHWLPVVYRIRHKLCIMIHAAGKAQNT